MGGSPKSEEQLRHYLLGELHEQEQQELEERLLTDRDFFKQLLLAEDDLIDDYTSGVLSPPDRQRVESFVLCTPARRAKVSLAKGLARYASSHLSETEIVPLRRQHNPTKVRLIAGLLGKRAAPVLAGFLVVVSAAATYFVINSRFKNQLADIRSQLASAQERQAELGSQLTEQAALNRQLQQDLANERDRQAALKPQVRNVNQSRPESPDAFPAGLIAFALNPGSTRDGSETSSVKLPASAKFLRLELFLNDKPEKSYTVAVSTMDGHLIAKRSTVKPHGDGPAKTVVVTLSAKLFKVRDYMVTLTEDVDAVRVATYYFTVVHR